MDRAVLVDHANPETLDQLLNSLTSWNENLLNLSPERSLYKQLVHRTSGLSEQNSFRVDGLELAAGVVDRHLPVDAALRVGDID